MRKIVVTAYDEKLIDGVVELLKQVGIKHYVGSFKSAVPFLRDSFSVGVNLNRIEEAHIRDTIASALAHVAPSPDSFRLNEFEVSR